MVPSKNFDLVTSPRHELERARHDLRARLSSSSRAPRATGNHVGSARKWLYFSYIKLKNLRVHKYIPAQLSRH